MSVKTIFPLGRQNTDGGVRSITIFSCYIDGRDSAMWMLTASEGLALHHCWGPQVKKRPEADSHFALEHSMLCASRLSMLLWDHRKRERMIDSSVIMTIILQLGPGLLVIFDFHQEASWCKEVKVPEYFLPSQSQTETIIRWFQTLEESSVEKDLTWVPWDNLSSSLLTP